MTKLKLKVYGEPGHGRTALAGTPAERTILSSLGTDQYEELTKAAILRVVDELYVRYPNLGTRPTYAHIKAAMLTVAVYPEGTLYVYAVPWARGWSVFVDDREPKEVPTWNTVKDIYKGLQRPIHCERGKSGCWTIPPSTVAKAAMELLDNIHAMNAAKHAVYVRDRWPRALYWYFTKFKGNNPSFRHDQPWKNWR